MGGGITRSLQVTGNDRVMWAKGQQTIRGVCTRCCPLLLVTARWASICIGAILRALPVGAPASMAAPIP